MFADRPLRSWTRYSASLLGTFVPVQGLSIADGIYVRRDSTAMKKLILGFLLRLSLCVSGHDAAGSNGSAPPAAESAAIDRVRSELEAMLETDQSYRRELAELEKKHGRESAELKEAWTKQAAIDGQNIQRLEAIIDQYGWPGIKRFGVKAGSAAFLILQHSDLQYQKKYLPLVREAAAQGEMRGSSLALLEDRVRLREGHKQIYGSQVVRNSANEWEPLPLEDEEKVHALRAGVGLPPLADYLKGFAERGGGTVSSKWMRTAEESQDRPSAADESDIQSLRSIEDERLRSLVEARLDVFDKYHSTEYQLISPVGMAFSYGSYREAIGSGKLDYLDFEPDSPIVIRIRGNAAILRYQAKLEFAWEGKKQNPVRLWHTDYYEKSNGAWKAVWSQATQIW